MSEAAVEGVVQEAGNRSVEQIAEEENELLLGLLRLRARRGLSR
jgi:hypothetical protein